jgi:GR25 family glycosyltransferase involved in LPS biosynthesis
MNFAPIIVFAYNRPHYLEETLMALKNNNEAKDSDLHIYCDGPKINADEKTLALIDKVRQLARTINWAKNVYVVEAEVNKGLSRSVIAGVTEVINKYGKVIILEDDLVVAPHFLKYMNDALEIYGQETTVASISGHNFPINTINGSETLLLKSATTWGWATWKRGWDLFNPDAEKLINLLRQKKSIYEFDFNSSYPFYSLLKKVRDGKISSWGVCWYASIFLNEKLTLFPAVSMVKNIGMVGTNINSDSTNFLGDSYSVNPVLKFENVIEENPDFRQELIRHFKATKGKIITLRNLKKFFLRLIKKAFRS